MSQEVNYCHDFVWTAESISSFWDEIALEPRLQHLYFTRFYSENIVSFARVAGLSPCSNSVLDYGAGKGYLTRCLLEQGFSVTSLEFSRRSAEELNGETDSLPNWHGCIYASEIPTPLEPNSFSFVFSIETYEHLLEEWVEPYFSELYRLVKPGGRIFITTPSHENLDDSLIVCPKCNSRFHRWGHLRSITPKDLVNRAKAAGFSIVFCQEIDLGDVSTVPQRPHWKDMSYNSFSEWIKFKYLASKDRKTNIAFPDLYQVKNIKPGQHLVLIAEKE